MDTDDPEAFLAELVMDTDDPEAFLAELVIDTDDPEAFFSSEKLPWSVVCNATFAWEVGNATFAWEESTLSEPAL